MYNRRKRKGKEPTGASGHFDPKTGEGHTSQYYDDGNRVSWDTDGQGDSEEHWTNQNLGKKHDGRHTPPNDAQ